MSTAHTQILKQITRLKVQPEPGEIALIEFLCRELSDDYEIFFQPFLNGDRPDIVIMLKNYGVMIIEVKDWNLSSYLIDKHRRWRLATDPVTYIKSPIDQALRYKENLYTLHVPSLLERNIKNYKHWAIVNCAVYFHNASSDDIDQKMIVPFESDKKYQKFISHFDLIGRDNLNKRYLENLLHRRYLTASKRPSLWFDESLYMSFSQLLKPPYHSADEGINIPYTTEQRKLATSTPREQRIGGVVGSGKTCVLAARAVSAHKRTGKNVLVLTYNITLKNYIHDAISKVREDFSWEQFYINNYHQFVKHELNNAGVVLEVPDEYREMDVQQRSDYWENNYFSNIKLFQEITTDVQKYDVILIDEIQDYRYEWFEILKKCFLRPGGEYVLFGDEKQNIYNLELSNRDVRTNIAQRPTRMMRTFRLNHSLADAALDYQNACFRTKYMIDSGMTVDQEFSFGRVEYIEPRSSDRKTVVSLIQDFLQRTGSHPNDMAILGFTIHNLRELDAYYRYATGHKTTTMFETEEIYRRLILDSIPRSNSTICDGVRLIGQRLEEDKLLNALVALWVCADVAGASHSDSKPIARFEALCNKYRVNKDAFMLWVQSPTVIDILNHPPNDINAKIEKVRDNKKYHFWGNSGTTKISTIHSFKGWEVETLIVCIEPKFMNGEFKLSFEELIYTGFTRARSNLMLINCGNTDYSHQLKAIFGKTRV